jgi:hypothetical protein
MTTTKYIRSIKKMIAENQATLDAANPGPASEHWITVCTEEITRLESLIAEMAHA